jgi:hypothetical protein
VAEEAPVNQDSRLNRLRNGDKLPDPSKSGLAALMPFIGTLQATVMAPQPATIAAGAEAANDTSKPSGEADDSAEDGELVADMAAVLDSQIATNGQAAPLAVLPVPVVPAAPVPAAPIPPASPAMLSVKTATTTLDTPAPPTEQDLATHALPVAAAEIVPVSAEPGARELPVLKPKVGNAAKPTAAASAPLAPTPAVTAVVPPAAGTMPIAAAGVTIAQQVQAETAPAADERLPAGDELPADAAATRMPEGRAVANHGAQTGGNKNAAAKKGSGATLELKAKDAEAMGQQGGASPSRSASTASPTTEALTAIPSGLMVEAVALPPAAPLPSVQAAPVPTEPTSEAPTTPSGENPASPSRDAEHMNSATPRGLDVRSQAWRENLLETARLRMPGLGAAGTLQTITLQLQPRLMGTVTMTLALTASGGVQLRLGASSERTRRFFTAEAPAIAASFARGGLNVSRIEILENQSDPAAA